MSSARDALLDVEIAFATLRSAGTPSELVAGTPYEEAAALYEVARRLPEALEVGLNIVIKELVRLMAEMGTWDYPHNLAPLAAVVMHYTEIRDHVHEHVQSLEAWQAMLT